MPKKKQTEDIEYKKLVLMKEAINEIAPLVKDYYEKRLNSLDAPVFKYTTLAFWSLIVVILGGTGFLVYAGKLDTSNFTLIVGITLGYLMTFIKKLILVEEKN